MQQLRAQGYSTKMNSAEWGKRGRGALTRREQHNLINTNARSKLLNTPLTLLSLAHVTLQTDEPIRGAETLSPVGLTHADPKGKADAFDESR